MQRGRRYCCCGCYQQRQQTNLCITTNESSHGDDRLAYVQLPVENGEDLQILRYEHGQKYDEHWDWFDPEELEKMNMTDGNRIATVLMYLSGAEPGNNVKCLNVQVQRPVNSCSWF